MNVDCVSTDSGGCECYAEFCEFLELVKEEWIGDQGKKYPFYAHLRA